MNIKQVTLCSNCSCPCLNFDREEPTSCNLGYPVMLVWMHKQTKAIQDEHPENRIGEFDLQDISHKCELEVIKTKAISFIPERINIPV